MGNHPCIGNCHGVSSCPTIVGITPIISNSTPDMNQRFRLVIMVFDSSPGRGPCGPEPSAAVFPENREPTGPRIKPETPMQIIPSTSRTYPAYVM